MDNLNIRDLIIRATLLDNTLIEKEKLLEFDEEYIDTQEKLLSVVRILLNELNKKK